MTLNNPRNTELAGSNPLDHPRIFRPPTADFLPRNGSKINVARFVARNAVDWCCSWRLVGAELWLLMLVEARGNAAQ
jgi:hypothetical protein